MSNSEMERLKQIAELNLEAVPVEASGRLPEHYIQALNKFIEEFPACDESLQKSLQEDDAETSTKTLLFIKEMLADIHADALAKECLSYSRKMTLTNGEIPERAKAYVSVFLPTLTALSIDIQVAALSTGTDAPPSSEEGATAPPPSGEETAPSGEETPPPSGEEVAAPVGKKVILAVDDDTYCLDTLKEALKDLPYKVICATSGKAALNILESRRPDLFVLDIQMPEMDGISLAKIIRSEDAKTPIIFITGNATRNFIVSAVEAGASDFLVKPINPKRVAERISQLL
jgi:CheY-like chemotaxis protein